jgi:hypothetical protein
MTEWEVKKLDLCTLSYKPAKNGRIKLVEEISHVHFTSLTSLNLQGNGISSVEALPNVAMPHIIKLSVGTLITI